MVILPSMLWLEGSPFGFILDPRSSSGKKGAIKLKSPEGKNPTPDEAIQDESFHIELVDGKLNLKKDNHFRYYTLVQLITTTNQRLWRNMILWSRNRNVSAMLKTTRDSIKKTEREGYVGKMKDSMIKKKQHWKS